MGTTFNLESEFGIDSFDERAREKYLDAKTREELQGLSERGEELGGELAERLADGMRRWAIDRGCTHYTHWFQPLNGITAEKHDSFLDGIDEKGKAILSFSGKELIKGEPDASSFPSGGLRATFEARGYTAYDTSSPAFIMRDEDGACLYIPTAFCSYTKEALDAKTPLLRAMDYLSKEAVRALRILGDEKTVRVTPQVGAEQEYFLVDEEAWKLRKDLAYTGRTLFGAPSPKGQELEDHYFGPIRTKISSFMGEVNRTLWRLGVMAKTEHNEVAPSQHELASIYRPANIASDQNQIVMLVLKRVAKRHGLVCLLAEKPFEGVNGSGKHDNFSLVTDLGVNLYKPGKEPEKNLPFLLFLASTVAAVHRYAGLVAETAMSYQNDFRLGGHEAPPSVLSIYLGSRVEEAVDNYIRGREAGHEREVIATGAKALPLIYKDGSDRNRTSPFAFTGNKFEFRMLGSSANISEANTVLSTAIARVLSEFSDLAEKANDKGNCLRDFVAKCFKEHGAIVFDGDGYQKEWAEEAKRRGLVSPRSAVEAATYLESDEAKDLFGRSSVLSDEERESRASIKFEAYFQAAMIDARTMDHMARKLLLPAGNRYYAFLKEEERLGGTPTYCKDTIEKSFSLLEEAYSALRELELAIVGPSSSSSKEKALYAEKVLLPKMEALRKPLDELELVVEKKEWPLPSYGDLLFHTA